MIKCVDLQSISAIWKDGGTPVQIQILLLLCLSFICISVLTSAITTLRFQLWFFGQKLFSKDRIRDPPSVPYVIPYLGHAFGFIRGAPGPQSIWDRLLRLVPWSVGAARLKLAGDDCYILFSPNAISKVFAHKGFVSIKFRLAAFRAMFAMDEDDIRRFFNLNGTGFKAAQEEQIKSAKLYLLKADAANELTTRFLQEMRKSLLAAPAEQDVLLFQWLYPTMFRASMTAYFGSRLLEIYPECWDDFKMFEADFARIYFGAPRFTIPQAYGGRDRLVEGFAKYEKIANEECNCIIADPSGPVEWDPHFGCRDNRSREMYCIKRGMSLKGRASRVLSIALALNSNAIPATSWMVMHILDSRNPTLLSRVMKELRTAQMPGGDIDIPTLVSSPLLQSVYFEVLRLYMDVLLPREVTEEATLPMDSNNRRMHFKEGAIMMLPTYISHYAKENWDGPPANQFCGDRFLKTDAETDNQVLSTAGTGNKLFPYGGGNTMCPGRLFAKQEMLAGAAIVLLAFDIEVLGFVDEKGKPKKDFIGMKQTSPGTGVVHPGGDLRVRMTNKLSKEID